MRATLFSNPHESPYSAAMMTGLKGLALAQGLRATLLLVSAVLFTFTHRGCGVTRSECRDCFRRNGRCPVVDAESDWD